MAKRNILKAIRDWFKPKDNKKISEANRVTNYGGGVSTKAVQSEVKRSIVKAQAKREGERQEERYSAFKATPPTPSSSSKSEKPTPTKHDTFNRANAFKANKPSYQRNKLPREEMRKRLAAVKKERESYNKATGNKYNTEVGTDAQRARARQRIKMGEYQSDPKAAKWEYETHPIFSMATRTAANAMAFGVPDMASRKLERFAPKEMQEAEAIYRKTQEEHPWIRGGAELAGSLVGFGKTAKVVDTLGAKAVGKFAPRAAEKLAESKLIQGAAKRAVNRAVKKKIVGEASEELIKQVGKDKATKIVNALGTDIVQNLTTGAVYDVANATKDHELFSDEWWKEIGDSAKFNAVATGLVTGGTVLGGGKRLVKTAVDNLAKTELADDLVKAVVKGDAAEGAVNESLRRKLKEQGTVVKGTPKRLGENVDEAVESTTKNADDVRASSARTIEDIRAEMDEAHRVAGDVNLSAEERQTASERFSELNEELSAAQKQAESIKKEPPKTKATQESTKKAAKEAEENFEPKMRGRYEHLNQGLKKETEGKVGLRKGVALAEERASNEERKRIIKESGAEINQRIKDAHENAIHGGDFTYKVLTQGQRDDMFFESYEKIKNAESVSQVVEELEDKMDKILRDTESNPWGMTDQITLKDLSDMLAVEQYYKDAGQAMPPEYEEILTRLTNLQGTQYGQGQRGRYLLLMERSPRYREAMMTKDITKYIDNVFGKDRLESINRSLNKNHGEKDWLSNELKRIANYDETFANLPADERLAAANEAYKQLEKEILTNTKMSVWDVINLYRHTGMLSAIATGGRNFIGNTSQFLMRELSDKMTYFAERGLAKAGNVEDFKPTTVLRYKGKDSSKLANHLTNGAVGKLTKIDDEYFKKFSDPEYAKKITNVINDAVSDMMNIEKYETNARKGEKYAADKLGEKAIKGLAWLPRKVSKGVNFMLNEPDSWFVETRFRKSLMRYLEANGITDSASLAGKDGVLKDAIAHAKNHALEDTYKKANRVTSFFEKIRRAGLKHDDNIWRNLAKKGVMITLDAELPYLKVPVNVGINTVKYSPINVFKSLVDANTAIRRGDAKALSTAAEELSKGLTGTGLAILGFLLNCDEQEDENSNGFIAKAKDELKEYGIKDYSLKIGDHVYDISNIGQGATQLLMGTRAAEIINENGGAPKGFLEDIDLVRQCFAASFDSISEMGILENALGVIDAFSDGGDYEKGFSERVGDAATNIAWDYAGQFIPQPARGLARGMTSSDLDMGVKKGEGITATQKRLQSNVNKFVGAIPYVNENGIKAIGYEGLPHKVDSHGNLVNERKTNADKLKAVLNNTVNPVKATKVHIPEADKAELSVKDENGKPFKPNGFDKKREYKVKVGAGKMAEELPLTGKEREQVARAAKNAGYDMADALVKKGMFGDRLGERAQEILRTVPDDEEKARELIFSTDEWKNADNETRNKYLNVMYGQGKDGKNNQGVSRTRKEEAYVNIQGNSEGDFRYQNDLNWNYQKKYEENKLADKGIDKGTWADLIQSIYDANHKWDEEKGNVDNPNSAWKVKQGILAIEGLTPEQRVAAYQTIRGKRNGFGWYDWDGSSLGGYYRRRGYRRWRRRGRRGGSGGSSAKMDTAAFKAKKISVKGGAKAVKSPSSQSSSGSKATYKSLATSLKKSSGSHSSSNSNKVSVKYDTASAVKKPTTKKTATKATPPKVKFKKYEV